MEKVNTPAPGDEKHDLRFQHGNPLRRIAGGLILVAIGALFLARELGAALPAWLFTWKMLPVAAGLYIGIASRFRGVLWMLIMLTGVALVVNDVYPQRPLTPYVWPVLLIVLGLAFILRPKTHRWHPHHRERERHRQRYRQRYEQRYEHYWKQDDSDAPFSNEDYIDAVAVFGQIKKTPISKTFKGGDVTAFFGGAKINLSQADIEGTAVLDLTAVFGGIQLVVPPHWKIKSETAAIFGGIDDKRLVEQDFSTTEEKTLVLQGTVVFGGIEIKSF